jgi:subfamily B ATP-binding cassette protein MsbA
VSLLLRQHELTGGEIQIDDQNIAGVTQDSLRRAIAIVPQEPALFHRSIKENILYGNPKATDEEVIEVAKKAQAHEFISVLPEGYDTMVGERGVKLSGGQKQRISIARAILKNPKILILDEATSSLDSESEALVQEALEHLMKNRTTFIIAHRLSTIRNADKIVVVEQGEIMEMGNHQELLQKQGKYASLYQGQFIEDPNA